MDILLVEDDTTTQLIYQHYLKKLNYNSIIVNTGKKAIECITSEKAPRYFGIILDLGLPDIGGEIVLSRIRQYEAIHNLNNSPVPVIVTTAHSNPEQLRRCLAKGAQVAILKPLTFKTLATLLQNYLTTYCIS